MNAANPQKIVAASPHVMNTYGRVPIALSHGDGCHVWDVKGRGNISEVITDLDQPWGSSESCTSCGKCVQVCPTGALFVKGNAVGEMTKRAGFLTVLAQMRENVK